MIDIKFLLSNNSCLHGRTLTMPDCHAVVPDSIPGAREGLKPSVISLVSLGVIFGCQCVCLWHPGFRVSLV